MAYNGQSWDTSALNNQALIDWVFVITLYLVSAITLGNTFLFIKWSQ